MTTELRALRRQHQLSQDELGLRTGIDRVKLSRIERGYARASDTEVARLAEALRVSRQRIMGMLGRQG